MASLCLCVDVVFVCVPSTLFFSAGGQQKSACRQLFMVQLVSGVAYEPTVKPSQRIATRVERKEKQTRAKVEMLIVFFGSSFIAFLDSCRLF